MKDKIPERLPCTNDLIFSMCIKKESALSLINAVKQDFDMPLISKLDSFTVEDVYTRAQQDLSGCRLDVTCTTDEGSHWIDIEMQTYKALDMLQRSLFYMAQIIVHSKESGSDNYNSIPRISVINVLDYSIRKDSKNYHSVMELRYLDNPTAHATDLLIFHNIERPKFREVEFNIDDPLHRWLYYFDNSQNSLTDPIIKEMVKMDNGLSNFNNEYNTRMSDTKSIVDAIRYETRQFERQLMRQYQFEQGRSEGIELGRSEGIELGRSEGIELGRSEGIELGEKRGIELGEKRGQRKEQRRMLGELFKNGLPYDTIAKIVKNTGISDKLLSEVAAEYGIDNTKSKPPKRRGGMDR